MISLSRTSLFECHRLMLQTVVRIMREGLFASIGEYLNRI
jgi:hypothetical protein